MLARSLGQASQHLEELRERLRHAFGIGDGDPGRAQARHREAHRDTVVVVRLHLAGLWRAGVDRHGVPRALDGESHASKLRRGGDRSVALLVVSLGDATDGHRAVGEGRDRHQGGRDVAHAGEVRVDGAQARGPLHRDRVGLDRDLAAHAREHVEQPEIALRRARAQARHHHVAAGDRRRREEVRRGGSVRLDRVAASRVALARRDPEAAIAVALGAHAELLHCGERHRDVRRRDQVALDLDLHVARGVRSRHQQRAQILARDVAAHARATPRDAPRAHDHGRTTGALTALRVDPERPQAVEQRLDRPLAHRRRAVDHERAATDRDGGRQEARGGAGVADLQGRLRRREPPVDAVDRERLRDLVGLDARAEGLECLVHVARVVREERASDLGAPARERGDEQRPVRVALRSGQLDHGVERPRDRLDGQRHVGFLRPASVHERDVAPRRPGERRRCYDRAL